MADEDQVVVNTRWLENMSFETEINGHRIILDAEPHVGGEDLGPRPKPFMLAALGGCTGMDVVSIMKKKRQEFDAFEVEVIAEKSKEPPNYLPRIEMVFRIWGEKVSEDALVRSIELSKDKYCTVSNTLNGKAEITYRYEINPPRG